MTRKIVTADIPIGQIRGHRCAWKGCAETFPFADDLPSDWRWLMLWWGDVGDNPLRPAHHQQMDRDAVLCPKHAGQLHNEVLEDIGQRLNQTEGSA